MYYNNPAASDGQFANGIWTNYWSVWHLNEDPTLTAPQYKDSTSNNRHGTAVNAPLRGAGYIGYAADLDAAGNIGVQAGNGAAAKSAYVVNNNAWRHVTVTRSATTGTVGFFVNGVNTANATSETGNKTLSFDRLGSMVNTGTANYQGYLDEFRMVSGVRTAAQIKADYKYMTNTHLYYNSPETP